MKQYAVRSLISTIVAGLAVLAGHGGAVAQPLKAAVFGFELLDTSEEGQLNGQRADQTGRVALATAELKRLLDASGQIAEVDLTPQAATIEKDSPLFKCNGCEQDIARALGADVSISGL